MWSEAPPANMHEVCRLCSSSEGRKISIFACEDQVILINRISECCDVVISTQDTLSKKVCVPCLETVTAWFSFRESCRRAQDLQKKWYSISSGPIHLHDEVSIKTEPLDVEYTQNDVFLNEDVQIKQEELDISDDEDMATAIASRPWEAAALPNVNWDPKLDESVTDATERHCPTDLESLSEHIIEEVNLESEVNRFHCQVCDNNYFSYDALRQHEEETHLNSYKCTLCLKPFPTARALEEHKTNCPMKKTLNRVVLPKKVLPLGRYSCKCCQQTFTDINDLDFHKKSYCVFPCPRCLELFYSCHSLELHLKNAHGEIEQEHELNTTPRNQYQCNFCSSSFPRLLQLEVHERVHNVAHKCPSCPRTFNTQHELRQHQKSHTITSPSSSARDSMRGSVFNCVECQVTFPRLHALHQHQANVHASREAKESVEKKPVLVKSEVRSRPHTCIKCNKKFSFAALEKHMLTHSSEKRYACPVCHMRMKHKLSVQQHLSAQHNIQYLLRDIKADHDAVEEEALWSCNLCELRFVSRELMDSHQTLDHQEDVVRCAHCSYSCRGVGELRLHEHSHVKSEAAMVGKLFNCSMCPKTYRTQKSLIEHQNQKNHVDPSKIKMKIFSCLYCNNSYNNLESLKIHRQKKHGVEVESPALAPVHRCRVCETEFKYRNSLKRHMQTQHAITCDLSPSPKKKALFGCEHCAKTFDSDSALISHRGWHTRTESHSSSVPHISNGDRTSHKTCPECNLEFLTVDAYKLHSNFHSQSKNIEEMYKQATGRELPSAPRVKQESAVRRHTSSVVPSAPSTSSAVQVKLEGAIQKCTHCGRAYKYPGSLKRHAMSCVGQVVTPVEEVPSTSRAIPTVHHVTRNAVAVKQETCSVRLVKMPDNLSKGKASVSSKALSGCGPSQVKKEAMLHECKHCGRRYARYGSLKNHLVVCIMNDEIPPPEVSPAPEELRPTRRSARLKLRRPSVNYSPLRIQMQMFTCDVCSRKFDNKPAMTCHRSWHTRGSGKLIRRQSVVPPAQTVIATPAQTVIATPAQTAVATPAPNAMETPAPNAMETPAPNAMETPAQTAMETPAQTAMETSAQAAMETPAQTAMETPAQTAMETPAQTAVATPAQTAMETPAQAAMETPAQTAMETPAPNAMATPAQTAMETPAQTARRIPAGLTNKRFSCDFCTETFMSAKAHTTHANMHLRRLSLSGSRAVLTDKVFTCSACPERFDSYAKLSHHRQKHIREIFPPSEDKKGRRKRQFLKRGNESSSSSAGEGLPGMSLF